MLSSSEGTRELPKQVFPDLLLFFSQPLKSLAYQYHNLHCFRVLFSLGKSNKVKNIDMTSLYSIAATIFVN